MRFFISELKKFAINATRTNRIQLLDSADTIRRIINGRIPGVLNRWAKETCKLGVKDEKDSKVKPITFKHFTDFLSKQAEYHDAVTTLKRKDDSGSKPASSDKKPNQKQGGKDAAIAATNVEPTATTGKGGGKKNKGRGGAQKAADAPPKDQSVAATLANGAFGANSGSLPRGGGGMRGGFRGGMRGGMRGRGSGRGGRGGFLNGRPNFGRPSNGRPSYGSPANNQQQPTATTTPSIRGAHNSAGNGQGWACAACRGTIGHKINTCPTFLKASMFQRHQMMKFGNHCYRCFEKGHRSIDCDVESTKCDKCGKTDHHTVFHVDKRPNPNNQQ